MRSASFKFLVIKGSIQVGEGEFLGLKRLKVETNQFFLSLLITGFLYLNVPIEYFLV